MSASHATAMIRLKELDQIFTGSAFPEKLPAHILTKIAELAVESFALQPDNLKALQTQWRRINVENFTGTKKFCKFYVARKQKNLEIIIPLTPTHRNPSQKTAGPAYKIVFSASRIEVLPVFRLTTASQATPFHPKDQNIIAEREIRLRTMCNALPHFAELLEWGQIEGSRTHKNVKYTYPKVMFIDKYYPGDLRKIGEVIPNYNCVDVATLATHVLKALQEFHVKGFVHSDLKIENILINTDAAVTDLGLSTLQNTPVPARGTSNQLAPELIMALYRKESLFSYKPSLDMWGVGIIAYMLLNPLEDLLFQKTQDVLVEVLKNKTQFQTEKDFQTRFPFFWPHINEKIRPYSFHVNHLVALIYQRWQEEITAFIKKLESSYCDYQWLQGLLKMDPKDRISAEQALVSLKNNLTLLDRQDHLENIGAQLKNRIVHSSPSYADEHPSGFILVPRDWETPDEWMRVTSPEAAPEFDKTGVDAVNRAFTYALAKIYPPSPM